MCQKHGCLEYHETSRDFVSGSGVYIDDIEDPFVPVQSGQLGLLAALVTRILRMFCLMLFLTVKLTNEVIFYSSQTDVGTSVNLQLLVSDPAKISFY